MQTNALVRKNKIFLVSKTWQKKKKSKKSNNESSYSGFLTYNEYLNIIKFPINGKRNVS